MLRRIKFRLGLYWPRFHKEKAGVISDGTCWVIFHGPWMYGPTDTLFEAVYQMVTEWRNDRHLIG